MTNPLVSLIITTYNKEKYIKRCLQSVVDQNNDFLQVIIVDDGSKDETRKICSKFSNENNNFELYIQKNSGVSSARNKGLSHALGVYVMFLDGDDYLAKSYIEEVFSKINSDFLVTGYATVDKGIETFNRLREREIVGSKDIEDYVFSGKTFPFFSVVWAKIFKNSIIKENNLTFSFQSYGEDTIFVMQYLKYVKKLQLSDLTGYYNVIIEDTLSRKKIDNMWLQLGNILKMSNDSFDFKYSKYWIFLYLRNIKLLLLNSRQDYKSFIFSCNQIRREDNFKKINKNLINSKKDYILFCFLKYNLKYLLFLAINMV